MSSFSVIIASTCLLFLIGLGLSDGRQVPSSIEDKAPSSKQSDSIDALGQTRFVGFSAAAHARTTSYYMTHACERTTLHLTCPQQPQRHVMYVSRATYGRHTRHNCPPPIMTADALNICLGSTRRPTEKVSAECNGKESCRVDVVNTNFGDPCARVFKYLEVYYYCVPLPF